MPPPLGLITGASSGIGASLARCLAARGFDLVLTARRQGRLEALASELRDLHGVAVTVIACDLARPGAAGSLLAELGARGLQIHTLVNNAGFGLRGDYTDNSWLLAEAMLQLMVSAPAQLCHGLLPAMRARGEGAIVNVASLAGLIPGLPGSTLYSASKAFLIRFSQSLAAEVAGDPQHPGVRVLAVCPGYVRSEFHAVLGVQERMQRLPGVFWMDADDLATRTVMALDRSQPVLVPGVLNRSIAALARLLPENASARLSRVFSRRYRSRG
jgi:short-subunit dehydrogenase